MKYFHSTTRFHANSTSGDDVERNCALCLVALPPNTDAKVCKKCYEKHNNHSKYGPYPFAKVSDLATKETAPKPVAETLPEHYCNLCQKPFPNATELEEHLIEHSFRGCEDRGYNCYICSAIFTLPCGLHQHMIEHGPKHRPYDCNLCSKKFYFRAELENHVIDHESGRIRTSNQAHSDTRSNTSNGFKQVHLKQEHGNEHTAVRESHDDSGSEKDKDPDFKTETQQYASEPAAEDDDEYIEVEKIGENTPVSEVTRRQIETKSPEKDDHHERSPDRDDQH